MALVYSTDVGRINPEVIKEEKIQGDGIVRIQRQTSGRKGKGVCVISGLSLEGKALVSLASELKRRTGCGGAIKNYNIEIQGDHREMLKKILEEKGFNVKFSGG
ncbi:stress response translation initiation inhibitor YciH [Otariodibacter sp.]|uniref:stress response translation initiation inhibitor YciH n=1 Tax=Otariodibacter sp. TaxID=3030919 RepID=UPI002613510C|nr:stress response translation initiation inhibitor YciH [Otariodibacter sp.]